MSVFAGFWVDGAVRKPEARHYDSDDMVIAKKKRKGDGPAELDICQRSFSKWDCVFWLDTTERESLTPAEILSILHVMWPQFVRVEKFEGDNWRFDGIDYHTPIEWGDLTEYPPPDEPQWSRVTRENVWQYLFRECRFKNLHEAQWKNGKIAGWDDQDNCCLVNSDAVDHMPIVSWSIVEAQA